MLRSTVRIKATLTGLRTGPNSSSPSCRPTEKVSSITSSLAPVTSSTRGFSGSELISASTSAPESSPSIRSRTTMSNRSARSALNASAGEGARSTTKFILLAIEE